MHDIDIFPLIRVGPLLKIEKYNNMPVYTVEMKKHRFMHIYLSPIEGVIHNCSNVKFVIISYCVIIYRSI